MPASWFGDLAGTKAGVPTAGTAEAGDTIRTGARHRR